MIHLDIRQDYVPALRQPDEAEKALQEIKTWDLLTFCLPDY
jgi:hypothetical protein